MGILCANLAFLNIEYSMIMAFLDLLHLETGREIFSSSIMMDLRLFSTVKH